MGEPPKVEVTIENLNDNVDKQFLHTMIAKHGTYEEMTIYYHPSKRKHLGLARIVFEEVRLQLFNLMLFWQFETLTYFHPPLRSDRQNHASTCCTESL